MQRAIKREKSPISSGPYTRVKQKKHITTQERDIKEQERNIKQSPMSTSKKYEILKYQLCQARKLSAMNTNDPNFIKIATLFHNAETEVDKMMNEN